MAFPSSDTWGSLIDEVILALQGWGMNKDQLSTLQTGITSGSTTITLTHAGDVGRGLIEIDEELIWVDSADGLNLTIPPWGRGFKGTIAASHSAGAAVYVNPTWPRSVVAREINNTIKALYPGLFAVKATSFSASTTTWQYEIPADAERLLEVQWRYNTIDGWQQVSGWELSHSADTDDFATGKFLSLPGYVPTSATVRVLYAAAPTTFSSVSDAYSVTGLPATSKDVIVLGTAARLTPWLDVGRLPVQTAEADALDSPRPLGTSIQAGKELRNQYNARLQEERRALYMKYPIRAHKVR
jgi:hypothetical protein